MSDNIHILELSGYEAPVIKESKREEWVEYGEDNNYFKYLIDRYTNTTVGAGMIVSSATNESIDEEENIKEYTKAEIELNAYIRKNYPE